MHALLFAIQFLTRLPVAITYKVDPHVEQQSLYWHGVVGLLIGGLLIVTAWVATAIFSQAPLLQAVLIVILWVLITGGLHLDGLGDSADAWLGGYGNAQKTLAIMKDPSSGPAAVIAITLLLLLKVAVVSALIASHSVAALLFAPAIARLGSMCLFLNTAYVRDDGLGKPFSEGILATRIYGQCAIAGALLLLLTGQQGLIAILLTSAAWYYARRLMMNRIQGTTGDTAGALIEVLEAVVLLSFCVTF